VLETKVPQLLFGIHETHLSLVTIGLNLLVGTVLGVFMTDKYHIFLMSRILGVESLRL